MPSHHPLLAAAAPAAGAPLTQILIGTAFAGTMTIGVLLIGWLHRTGRTTLPTRIGEQIGRFQGLPPWASLPLVLGFSSLGLAFLGVYWDISLHVDNGRDEGPLANLAHYPILFGLQGLFLAGVLALVLPPKGSYVGPTAVKVGRNWRTTTASIALMSCATIGYLGFPLDDVWHRLFGQDVTLWGPTHLMMIFGAVLSILASRCCRSRESARSARRRTQARPGVGAGCACRTPPRCSSPARCSPANGTGASSST